MANTTEYVIQYMEKDTKHPALAAYSFKEVRVGKDIDRSKARMTFRVWWHTAKKQNKNIVSAELVEIVVLERRGK